MLPGSLHELRSVLERETLDRVGHLFGIGVLCFVIFAAIEVAVGRFSWALGVEALALVTTTLLLRFGASSNRRAMGFVLGCLVTGAMALVHFGPLLGTGVILSLSPVAGTLFFGPRGGLTTTGLVVLAIVVVALAVGSGVLHVGWVAPSVLAWARITTTTTLACAASVAMFHRAQAMAAQLFDAHVATVERERLREEERATVRDAMLRSEHLAGLGRLAGSVAHDMNTALTAARTHLELAREEADPSARAELFDEVARSTQRAAAAASQVLRFARRAPALDDVCVPADVVSELGVALRRVLPDNIEVRVRRASTGTIRLPSVVLERALLHAALDAADTMPQGGILTLVVEQSDESVVVQVHDEAKALLPTEADRLAPRPRDPMVAVGPGSVLLRAATQGEGTVALEVRPGGASLRMRFPSAAPLSLSEAAQGPDVRLSHAEPTVDARPGNGKRILVLDDEADMRRAYQRVLKRAGYEAFAFESVAEAELALGNGRFDLLIADAIVPGGGVPEFIRAFRAAHPLAPVLVCSGHIEEDVLLDGIDRRDVAFLAKPFSGAQLQQTLDRLLMTPDP